MSESKFFSEIKEQSLRQNLFNLFIQKQYGISLYETLKLYKKDKNNDFYKTMIYLNLLEIYKSRLNYTINRYVPSFDNKNNTASLNRFISFINNIKMIELETINNHFKS